MRRITLKISNQEEKHLETTFNGKLMSNEEETKRILENIKNDLQPTLIEDWTEELINSEIPKELWNDTIQRRKEEVMKSNRYRCWGDVNQKKKMYVPFSMEEIENMNRKEIKNVANIYFHYDFNEKQTKEEMINFLKSLAKSDKFDVR